jgi:hypothetical protein
VTLSTGFTEFDVAMVWIADLSDGRIAILANTPYLT